MPEVSIHAPAWGATADELQRAFPGVFQSTRPRGARRHGLHGQESPNDVSIHAPAWGATKN